MTSPSSIRNQLAWSITATAIQGLYAGVLFLLVGKYLGIDGLGNFAWAFQATMLLALLAAFGNHQSAVILGASPDHSPSALWLAGRAWSLRRGIYWGGVSVVIALAIGISGDQRGFMVSILTLGLPATVIVRFLTGQLIGMGGIKTYSHLTVGKITAALATSYLVLATTTSVVWLCISLVVVEWGSLWATYRITRPSNPEANIKTEHAYQQLCNKMGWSLAISETTNRIDLLIVGLFATSANAGLYSLISTFGRTPLMLSQSYLRIVIPELAANAPPNNAQRALSTLNKSIRSMLAWLTTGAALLWLCLFLGESIWRAYGITQTSITLFVIFIGIFSFQASLGSLGSVFLCWGKTDIQLFRQALLLIFLIPATTLGILKAGLMGATVALAIGYAIYIVTLPPLVIRTFLLNNVQRAFTGQLISSIPMVILLILIVATIGSQ